MLSAAFFQKFIISDAHKVAVFKLSERIMGLK